MNKSVFFLGLRTFLYMLLVAGLVHFLSLEGIALGPDAEYSEYSLTETLESCLAVLSALLFFAAARLDRSIRPIGVMLATLCLLMFIREADYFLDNFVFDGAWQVLVLLALVSLGVYLWKQGDPVGESINRYAQSPSAGIFISGFLVLLVFSRLFGRAGFWQSLMGDDYMRVVKNVAEEGTEVMGYALITIAAIELLLASIKKARAG